jgi:hypothetical protein
MPAQLAQQVVNQSIEAGRSFLELKRGGRIRRPEVGRAR